MAYRSAIAALAILGALSMFAAFASPLVPSPVTVVRSDQSAAMMSGFVLSMVIISFGSIALHAVSLLIMRRYAPPRGHGPALIELTCSRIC